MSGSALLDLVRRELAGTDWWQTDLSVAVGCTEKHLSQLLNGHVRMSEEWATRILLALGRRLVVATVPARQVGKAT